MKLNKKPFQKFFKLFSYGIFKIIYGKIEGIIDPNKSNKIDVKFIKKKNNASYNVYKIANGRLYTDRVNDTAIIKNNKVVKDASFQFRDKKTKVVNVSAEENAVFEKGTPRIKRKINGKVLSLLTGGGGNDNYWHWLFDVLPRIDICENVIELDKIDFFLLPDNKRKFQIETLEILGIPQRKQISSVNFRHIISKELYVTSHPVVLTNDATDGIQNMPLWISEWLKKKFIKKNINEKVNFSKKIYIDRGDSVSNVKDLRSISNEEEIKQFLLQNGFKIIKLGDLHFKDQVLIFNNADIIVGLHGAGFANLAFCKSNTKIIELRNRTAGKMIENLAIKNKLFYKPLNCETNKFDHSNQFAHINVPIKKLEEFIKDSYGS
jgi:capsular polysaccharide biosynthesis protein